MNNVLIISSSLAGPFKLIPMPAAAASGAVCTLGAWVAVFSWLGWRSSSSSGLLNCV